MAITSSGYPGAFITPVQFSQYQAFFGARYGLGASGAWLTTALTTGGAVGTVQVAPGSIFGRGVTDTLDVATNVACSTFTGAAGTKRYDTIVARRTWGATNTTTLVAVAGSSTPVLAAARLSGPGVQDDQPLALVELTAGTTAPTGVWDLRVDCSKLSTASDLRALVDPDQGDEAVVAGVRYRYATDGSGSLGWHISDKPGFVLDPVSGWLPTIIAGSKTVTLASSGGGPYGSTSVAFAQPTVAYDKYAWLCLNGDSIAQPYLTVRGTQPQAGRANGLIIMYSNGYANQLARFNYVGTYINS